MLSNDTQINIVLLVIVVLLLIYIINKKLCKCSKLTSVVDGTGSTITSPAGSYTSLASSPATDLPSALSNLTVLCNNLQTINTMVPTFLSIYSVDDNGNVSINDINTQQTKLQFGNNGTSDIQYIDGNNTMSWDFLSGCTKAGCPTSINSPICTS